MLTKQHMLITKTAFVCISQSYGDKHLWYSVFLDGIVQGSIELRSRGINWDNWTLLPLAIRNLYGGTVHCSLTRQ